MSLKDELDALFGPLEGPAFDPEGDGSFSIPRRPKIGALPDASDLKTGTTDEIKADPLEGLYRDRSVRASGGDSGFFEDNARLLGAGALDVGEMVTGVGEYVARQNKYLRPSVAPAIEDFRTGVIGEAREGVLSGISPDLLEQSGREFLTLDPERTIWQGGPVEVANSVASKFMRSLPATLAVMLPAGRLFRAGSTNGALTYLGASEGGMSVGAIQNNIADEIAAMTNEELLQESEAYRRVYDRVGGNEELARQEFTAEAQGAAPLVGGAAVASISLATGRLLKPIFSEGGMGLGRRTAQGFLAEFPQEGSQGASEQLVQNYAAQIYDENRNLSEGVAEAFVQEGVIGGLTGAGVAGAFGERPARALPPPQEGPGGQFGIPGIGPAQPTGPAPAPEADPGLRTEDPAEVAQRTDQLGLVGGLDLDPRSGRDLSQSTEAVMVPPGADSPTGASEQGVLPMTLRERGRPVLQESPRGARLPDQLDQPTAEPVADLEAQLADMQKTNGRSAVYVSPAQRNTGFKVPKGAVVIPNFDGKGGQLIAKNQEAARYARERRAEGGSIQTIIGELTLAGAGKPNVKAGYAVQLLDENEGVARESLVATKGEALQLERAWKKDGQVRTLTGPEALERRRALLEQEEVDLSQDQRAVDRRNEQLPLGEDTPTVLPPFTSPAERASEKVRQALPFEERTQATSLTRRVTSEKQAAERLAENANIVAEKDERRRIGGFFEPGQMEFTDDFQREQYTTAWNEALDAELTLELSKNKAARTKAQKQKTTALKKLSVARSLGKPKRKTLRSERLAIASAAVDKSAARTRLKKVSKDEPPVDDFGELDPKALTPDDIDDLADYELRYTIDIAGEATPQVETVKPSKVNDRIAAIRKREGDIKISSKMVETQDLNVAFEQAINTYVARNAKLDFPAEREEGKPVTPDEVASDAPLLESEYRAQYDTPGKKIKLVRRERNNARRLADEQRSVRATEATVKAKEGTLRAKKKQSSAALTVDKRATEESKSQRIKRKEKVKKADSRLKAALRKTNQFLNRFETQGDYGTFVAENTNIDGSLTKEGRDFIYAREYLNQIKQWGDSIIASGNQSNDYADMANGIAGLLERLQMKTMNPDKFATEWASLARSNEFEDLLSVPTQFKESMGTRQTKIDKANRARHNANERQRTLENEWKNDKVWNEIVGPMFRKFSEASLLNAGDPSRNAYYKPTEFEMENLRYALRSYRKMHLRYDPAKWYKPIRSQLEYYGFEFDEAGDLIVQNFSPSENLLGPGFIAKHGESKKSAEDSGREAVEIQATQPQLRDRSSVLANQEVAENRRAVLNIRQTNALIQKFKDMVAPSKTTITGLKRQEQRMIRGLRKIGAWVDVSPGMGRISIGGFKSKTYRLVGPRLDARTMNKADAKAHIARIAKIAMPRELSNVASNMTSTDDTVRTFIDENQADFFLEAIAPVENNDENVQAANTLGDLLESGRDIDGNTALQELWRALPDGFYKSAIERIINYDFSNVQVAYGEPSDFQKGEFGKFQPSTNMVLLNRDAMSEAFNEGDRVYGARVLHTFTHEIYHAGTHMAMRKSNSLRETMGILRGIVSASYRQETTTLDADGNPRPVKLPYGLQAGVKLADGTFKARPIDEFVVEAFSNPEIQALMKRTKIDGTPLSTWQRFVGLVQRVFGIEVTANVETAWDALMLVEDVLFEQAGETGPRNASSFNLEAYDTPLRSFADKFLNRIKSSEDIIQRVRDVGSTSLMNLMTMEQFVERYSKYFNGFMDKYFDAFRRRNARASELTHLPEEISADWTRVEEQDAIEGTDHALEISRIGTEATLHQIAADEALDSEANEHLSEELHDLHKQLHDRYNALSPEAKDIYQRTQAYYSESIKRESMHLLRSALRGIAGIEFSPAQLEAVKTREDLTELLKEHINAEEMGEMLDTLYRMARVPTLRKGNYFPATRYGEEVVYASKMSNEEIYEDRKEAWGRRRELAATDPTLDVQMVQTEDGNWAVRVFEREFVMSESVSEARAERERLVEEYGEENVGDVQKRLSKQMDEAINSNAALASILRTLKGNDAAQAAIKNFYLRSLSDASFRKHEVKRKNRRGLNYDLQHRNLANYAKQSAYYTSQLEFGWVMSEAISEMDKFTRDRIAGPGELDTRELSRVLNHLIKRDEMSADLPDIYDLVRKGVEGTHFFMLTSPSYWMINASQPWMVTLPTIAAKHGWGQASAAMAQVQRSIITPLVKEAKSTKGGFAAFGKKGKSKLEDAFNVIDQLEEHIKQNDPANYEAYKKLLDELRNQHIVDINVFTEMRDVAAAKKQGAWGKMVEASRIMAHLTEVNNRVLVALAAYQLEINNGASVEEATKYAGETVSRTQFNYSSANKPPLFQAGGPIGGVAPLMFQFMQWPQHMYAHLIRNFSGMVEVGVLNKSEARSALLGLLGTHAAVGGLVGMALQPIKWAVGFALMALGDDDEPYTFANAVSGRTFDRKLSEISSDLFGTTASTVISKGLPAAAGIDLSSRMSMGTLYFIDMRGDTAESALGSVVASFGGATLNQAINMSRGLGQAMDGDVLRGVETASPKIARDILRTFRYYQDGLVNGAGDTVIPADEMGFGELTAQFFGFQPTEISQFYTAQNAIKDAERFATDRKAELLQRFRNAETSADRREALRDIRDFNRSFPVERITRSTLLRNRQSQREREASFRRYGANIDERKARQYAPYGDPYRQ